MSYWTFGELGDLLSDLVLRYAELFPESAGDYEMTPERQRERLYGRLEILGVLLGHRLDEEFKEYLHADINDAREYVSWIQRAEALAAARADQDDDQTFVRSVN